MNKQLKKRLLSFAWRLGSVMAIAGLNFIAQNVGDLSLPIWAVGLIGLITGEITKYLNSK